MHAVFNRNKQQITKASVQLMASIDVLIATTSEKSKVKLRCKHKHRQSKSNDIQTLFSYNGDNESWPSSALSFDV